MVLQCRSVGIHNCCCCGRSRAVTIVDFIVALSRVFFDDGVNCLCNCCGLSCWMWWRREPCISDLFTFIATLNVVKLAWWNADADRLKAHGLWMGALVCPKSEGPCLRQARTLPVQLGAQTDQTTL